MTKRTAILVGYFFVLAIISCKQESNEKKIIGKWHGTQENTCPSRMFSHGVKTVDYEFDANGKFSWKLTGNNGVSDDIVTMPDYKYKVIGDSVILTTDSFPTRIAHHISFPTDYNLELINDYEDSVSGKLTKCSVTTLLTREH